MKRKKATRLTDAEVLAEWDQDAHVRSLAMQAAREDHLQAREDVKRAVEFLRHMDFCRVCGDGPWTDCEEGRAALAFLAEVDPK